MKKVLNIMMNNAGRAILLVLFFLSPMAHAQQVEVGLRMGVDKKQLEVGDKLEVTLEFKQAGTGNGVQIGMPQLPTPEHLEITGNFGSDMFMLGVGQNIVTTNKFTVKLRATSPGIETLGPAMLIYIDNLGQKKEAKSNVVSVTVVEKTSFSLFGKKKAADPNPNQPPANPPPPAQPVEDDLRGLKPLLPESNMLIKLVFWLMLLGAIAVFVWRILRKPVKSSQVPLLGKPAQLKDAWKKLGNEDLSGKEFCLGLSNLVRECVQYRFNFPAVDSTTEEILKMLPGHKPAGDEMAAVEKILKACDRVLYADANLTGRDNLRSLCSSLLPKAPKN